MNHGPEPSAASEPAAPDLKPSRTSTGLRRHWSTVLTLLLAGVLLFLALRGIEWSELLATFQQAQPLYLVIGCLFLTASFFVRGVRWGILVSAGRRVSPLTMFWGTSAGYLGNTLLPARAGELIRSVLIGRATGLSKSYVLATALTERLLDAVFLVLISLVALVLLPDIPAWLEVAAQVFAVVGLIGLGVLLVAPRLEWLFRAILERLPLPDGLRTGLGDILGQFLLGMRALHHPGRAAGFVALSVAIWLGDAVFALIVTASLSGSLTIPQALVLLAALGLSSAAPSTPGYVGIYQFVAVTILPLFGWTNEAALAFILTFQAITIVVVLIWGFIGMGRLGMRRLNTREIAQVEAESVPREAA